MWQKYNIKQKTFIFLQISSDANARVEKHGEL